MRQIFSVQDEDAVNPPNITQKKRSDP